MIRPWTVSAPRSDAADWGNKSQRWLSHPASSFVFETKYFSTSREQNKSEEKILTTEGDQPQWDHVGVSSTRRQSDSERSIRTYLCVRPIGRHADACLTGRRHAGPLGTDVMNMWNATELQKRESINPHVSGPLVLYIQLHLVLLHVPH